MATDTIRIGDREQSYDPERPIVMLSRYIAAAMTHAQVEWLPNDREYYGHIPGLDGVWATGETEISCREELQSVLEDWLALGLHLHHHLPVVDGIDINVATVS